MRVILDRPGSSSLDLTDYADTLSFTTAAVGGFGGSGLVLPGPLQRWRREIPYLSTLRVTEGPRPLFEGQVEDLVRGFEQTTMRAFGLRRRLEQTSVQRIWSTRLIPWRTDPLLTGPVSPTGGLNISLGNFDVTDLSRFGVEMRMQDNVSIGGGGVGGVAVVFFTPGLVPLERIVGDLHMECTQAAVDDGSQNEMEARLYKSSDGSTWTLVRDDNITGAVGGAKTADFSYNEALASTKYLRLAYVVTGGGIQTAQSGTDWFAQWDNMRILGTTMTEDATGGFYGGSILRDLIALLPELTIGTIETGSEFTLETIERAVRANALSVIEEISGYYTHQWGVWEEGRFDWKAANLDQPQWSLHVEQLTGLQLNETVDNLIRTIYLNFLDATTLEQKEVSATSTDQRNPFVKLAKTKDATAQVGFPMTTNSAQRLADRLVEDQGGFPVVSGRLEVPAGLMVSHMAGPPLPAYAIRAGETVQIPDLPKTDPMRPGRDGQTIFHIVGTEANLKEGKVTLEVEGFQRRSDVLLARLASATRTVTG